MLVIHVSHIIYKLDQILTDKSFDLLLYFEGRYLPMHFIFVLCFYIEQQYSQSRICSNNSYNSSLNFNFKKTP